ncbi:hypothetical protein HETIRDRAFT_167504 [Heterobasidion irregulare TC 32-1]|uniref:Uncharacterized protein n=1 Tax=Heterobasidion irregulare (strain TC 32-1) TaxID=747525 RepID=W4KMN7_HETIT|nr:uncharacterized protein HETIRDRAFT_167504 [Heterobasidion irregulare TC 32-1]ETW86291.1 hypothetical protein HETIRDRAFT_167504 [Heterobasidion irregulare TC 32-1]
MIVEGGAHSSFVRILDEDMQHGMCADQSRSFAVASQVLRSERSTRTVTT